MLVKIKDKLFEVTDINGNQLKEDEIMIKKTLRALSYILNVYKEELNVEGFTEADIKRSINLYYGALEHAGINIRLREREDLYVIDLDN